MPSAYVDLTEEEQHLRELEREYWRMVSTGSPSATVEYGNDLDVDKFGSPFPLPPLVSQGVAESTPVPLNLEDPGYYSRCG